MRLIEEAGLLGPLFHFGFKTLVSLKKIALNSASNSGKAGNNYRPYQKNNKVWNIFARNVTFSLGNCIRSVASISILIVRSSRMPDTSITRLAG